MKKDHVLAIALLIIIGTIFFFTAVLKTQAEDAVNLFHQHYSNRDFEYIYRGLAREEFKEALTYERFSDFMKKLYDRSGKVKEAKRTGWGIFYKNVGLTFNLEYRTACEKGGLKEYFTLVRRGSAWRIFIYDPKFEDRP